MSPQERQLDEAPEPKTQRHGLLRLVQDLEGPLPVDAPVAVDEIGTVVEEGLSTGSVADNGVATEKVYTSWDAPKGHFED